MFTYLLSIKNRSNLVSFPLFNMLSKSIESGKMTVSWLQLKIANLPLSKSLTHSN